MPPLFCSWWFLVLLPRPFHTLPSFSVAWDGFFSCESAVLTRQVCSMHQARPPPPKKKRHIRDIYLWKSVRLKIYHCQESRLIRSLGMSGVNTSYPNWSVRVADDSLRSWKTMRLRQPPKWHIGFQVPAILARWCRSSNCTWSGLSRNLLTHMSMESKLTLSFNLRFNISLHSILHSP